MRASIATLLLLIACSDDGDRARLDITQNPATTLEDGGDPRQVAPLPPGSKPGPAIGVGASGGSSPIDGGGFSVDASVGEDDPVVGDAGPPGQFSCKTNNECTIRNVGSCCGYFPRCANANAIFTPPSCSDGVAGVCGFPNIDSCRCELGQCVGLQAGTPVSYP
ncbi:MAG: hypothetical protein ABW352_11990 [Polyangiales bacterium]